jgi:L-asparagine transporter-like permease
VPARAILAGSGVGAAAVAASVLSAERLFAMLVNATGMVMLIVYMLLVMGHVRCARGGGATPAAAWIAYLVLLAIAATIVSMTATPALASQAYAGLAVTAALLVLYAVLRGRGRVAAGEALPEGR